VLGVARVTKVLLPALERSGAGQIVVLGSVAGVEVYRGGAGYTAAKHAVHALTETLRLELLEKQIRVTEIAPGLVETEFSLVRFGGDRERAEAVYRDLDPLRAEDVAELIAFSLRPHPPAPRRRGLRRHQAHGAGDRNCRLPAPVGGIAPESEALLKFTVADPRAAREGFASPGPPACGWAWPSAHGCLVVWLSSLAR
jgi:short chain dehydrogenase